VASLYLFCTWTSALWRISPMWRFVLFKLLENSKERADRLPPPPPFLPISHFVLMIYGFAYGRSSSRRQVWRSQALPTTSTAESSAVSTISPRSSLANGHEEFIEMPHVADGTRSMPELPRVREAKRFAPVPDGFVRDGDATVREEVFDVVETQSKAVVEPDGVADDRWREPVAWIVRDIVGHPATMPAVASS